MILDKAIEARHFVLFTISGHNPDFGRRIFNPSIDINQQKLIELIKLNYRPKPIG